MSAAQGPEHHPDPLFLAQLLSTRLCHDLAGPVGAMANGAELIGDDPAMVDQESLDLLSGSAQAAAMKLRVLRAAFGFSGAVAADELPQMLTGWAGARASVEVPPPDVLARLPGEALQILLNLAVLALDGTVAPTAVAVAVEDAAEGRLIATATATGRGAREADALAEALTGQARDIGPRAAQAWLAGALVRRAGGAVGFEATTDGLAVEALFPLSANRPGS